MDENVAIVNVTQKQQHVTVSAAGGLRGLTGPKGDPGAALQITGSVDSYSELPSDLTEADAGKAWFNQADGKLYVWSGERFPNDGQGSQFEGPEGPAGPTGYSPTATVSKSGNTTTITITDKEGTTTATVDDGTQLTDGIINGAANGAVTVEGSKIALQTVGTPNLRDDAVTADKIADGSVGTDQLASAVMTAILDKIYPVGSIYMTTSFTTASQVQNAIGGTWVAWGSGRVPVGVSSTDTNFNSVEKTGGADTHRHDFKIGTRFWYGAVVGDNYNSHDQGAWSYSQSKFSKSVTSQSSSTNLSRNNGLETAISTTSPDVHISTGDTDTGSSLQPYITCYMYKRTA